MRPSGTRQDRAQCIPLFETPLSMTATGCERGQTCRNPVALRIYRATAQRFHILVGDVTGDWDTFRRQIPAGLSFGMSGFPYWTTDIGGFFRPLTSTPRPITANCSFAGFNTGLFVPSSAYTAIAPRRKCGSTVQMWRRPSSNTMISVIAFSFTFTPRPGNHQPRRNSHESSTLCLSHGSFSQNVSDEFIFGDSLLVNPVTERQATTRRVVLPTGNEWVDFWTGEKRRGGQTITVDAPIDRMPIFAKRAASCHGTCGAVGRRHRRSAGISHLRRQRCRLRTVRRQWRRLRLRKGARATIHLHWTIEGTCCRLEIDREHSPECERRTPSGLFWSNRDTDRSRIGLRR